MKNEKEVAAQTMRLLFERTWDQGFNSGLDNVLKILALENVILPASTVAMIETMRKVLAT